MMSVEVKEVKAERPHTGRGGCRSCIYFLPMIEKDGVKRGFCLRKGMSMYDYDPEWEHGCQDYRRRPM